VTDMTNPTRKHDSPDTAGPLRQVRLPGFITGHEVALGDVIKRATSYLGIRPCGGCLRRAATLNSWMVFTGRPPK
jgi:hypothetical protein